MSTQSSGACRLQPRSLARRLIVTLGEQRFPAAEFAHVAAICGALSAGRSPAGCGISDAHGRRWLVAAEGREVVISRGSSRYPVAPERVVAWWNAARHP